ncbi:hypothetical protein ACFLS1_12555 [Verrucomicrobiota bacterium]
MNKLINENNQGELAWAKDSILKARSTTESIVHVLVLAFSSGGAIWLLSVFVERFADKGIHPDYLGFFLYVAVIVVFFFMFFVIFACVLLSVSRKIFSGFVNETGSSK